MRDWTDPLSYREFFRESEVEVQDRLQSRFRQAFARTLAEDAARIGIHTQEWALEPLSGDGHLCPLVHVESRQAFLRPVGERAWSGRELMCVVDWSCSEWCKLCTDRTPSEVQNTLAGQRDPAGLCQFRAFITFLQGGFGLPRVQRKAGAAAVVAAPAAE